MVILKFFYSFLPATTIGLDLFSGTYLNKLSVAMLPNGWEQLDLRGPQD